MTEKDQKGKMLKFQKDFGNNSCSDRLNINEGGNPTYFFDKNVIFCMKHVLFLQAVFVGMRVAHSWQLSNDPSLQLEFDSVDPVSSGGLK